MNDSSVFHILNVLESQGCKFILEDGVVSIDYGGAKNQLLWSNWVLAHHGDVRWALHLREFYRTQRQADARPVS